MLTSFVLALAHLSLLGRGHQGLTDWGKAVAWALELLCPEVQIGGIPLGVVQAN